MQVLLSLIGNASEAAQVDKGNALIHLRAHSARDEGREWVEVDVEDNGPGILPDHLPRIFEPFFTTKQEGSGFGLYLASEILREQGGRLTATNLPAGGACFTIWLAPAEHLAMGSNPSSSEPGEAISR
jgi:C4-dicarboxylate-specific signal transduction histidine kinase